MSTGRVGGLDYFSKWLTAGFGNTESWLKVEPGVAHPVSVGAGSNHSKLFVHRNVL